MVYRHSEERAIKIRHFFLVSGVYSGPHERRLINDLLEKYNDLERPVFNESDALTLKFGLTLQQIIDVVSSRLTHATGKSTEWINFGIEWRQL